MNDYPHDKYTNLVFEYRNSINRRLMKMKSFNLQDVHCKAHICSAILSSRTIITPSMSLKSGLTDVTNTLKLQMKSIQIKIWNYSKIWYSRSSLDTIRGRTNRFESERNQTSKTLPKDPESSTGARKPGAYTKERENKWEREREGGYLQSVSSATEKEKASAVVCGGS